MSCAQVVAPTGGEKDIEAPQLLEVNPPQEERNFSEEKIKFTFSEFVKMMKFKDELLVSPPLKYSLLTKMKGKSLELTIQDTLKENTTYILNFGKGVVDITENNPVENFVYVFSTGEDIDTLSVKGRVKDAFSAEVEKGVLVMLYEQNEDSVPFKSLPNYVSRTDEEGFFRITNVKQGQYKAFVMKDANNNYLFDKSDKKIAFDTALIKVDSATEGLGFKLFEEDNSQQFIETQTEKGAIVTLVFNTKFDSVVFEILDTAKAEVLKHSYQGINKDSIQLFFNEMESKFQLDVSADTTFHDTITVQVDSMKARFQLSIPAKHPFYNDFKVKSNFPLDQIIADSIKILSLEDSSFLPFEVAFERLSKQLEFKAELEQAKSYQLYILPNAIYDIYGRSNDTIIKQFSVTEERNYGNLYLNIEQSLNEPLIVQLLDKRDIVLREKFLVAENKVEFLYLNPGEYSVRLIVDSNNDKVWTTGDYLKKRYPERVVKYNESITIRSNWDQDISWKIDWEE